MKRKPHKLPVAWPIIGSLADYLAEDNQQKSGQTKLKQHDKIPPPDPIQKDWEIAMGMHDSSGSLAEKEARSEAWTKFKNWPFDE